MLSWHLVHQFFEAGIAGSALCCSTFIFYLALFRTSNDAIKIYSHMLMMNAFVDLMYSACNFFFLPIMYINEGYFFLAIGNPFLPKNQFLAFTNIALQGFLVYCSVVLLPLQFYFRYRVVINKQLTTTELAKVFCIATFWPFMHGVFCYYTFQKMDPKYDDIFNSSLMVKGSNHVPSYGVGDILISKAMIAHFLNCIVITIVSYSVILVLYKVTSRKLRENAGLLSTATKRVQRQMEKMIFLQTFFPFIVLFIPATILPIAIIGKWNVEWIGEPIDLLMHSTPVFNSFSVIWCVPSYRRTVKKMLFKKNDFSATITQITVQSAKSITTAQS